MMRIRRVRIFSAAKAMGFLYAIIGLLSGAVAALVAPTLSLENLALPSMLFGLPLPSVVGLASLVVLPFLYWIVGALFGALLAMIYNITAGWFGGIEIEYE